MLTIWLNPKKLKANAKVKSTQQDKYLLVFKLFVKTYKLEIKLVKTENQRIIENKYPTVLLIFNAKIKSGIS